MKTLIQVLLAVATVSASAALAQDATRGQKLFEECAACHSPERGASNTVGPSLHGLVGRKAGEGTDFRFSPAMKRSGITWNAKTIDDFIADPQKLVPGNRMPYSGLPGAKDRSDLIAYLQSALK